MSDYETIIASREGRVQVIQLNRPKALNALNADSGYLATFLNRGHPSHAYTNLDEKAKRVVLFGQLSEAVKVGTVSRPLVSQT